MQVESNPQRSHLVICLGTCKSRVENVIHLNKQLTFSLPAQASTEF